MMYPLLVLSVITSAYVMQRVWLWFKLAVQEGQVVQDVLTVAQYDWERAEEIATAAEDLAIGRFVSAPLKLDNPTPENFHLAVQTAADKELVDVRGSNKLLESVIIIAPLLGILGTAGGLVSAFFTLRNGGAENDAANGAADLILQALISSASGIAIAILAYACFQLFVLLRARRVDYFSTVGNQLELIYLHVWNQPIQDIVNYS